MNFSSIFSQDISWITNVANILTILASLSFFVAVYRVFRNIWIRIRRKTIRPEYLSEREVLEYTDIFVKTRLQSTDPAFSINQKSYNINKFIKKHINKGTNQYHWILGESGMGKTAFLINLYFFYNCRIKRKYDVFYISLRDSDSIDKIKKIVETHGIVKSVLLLDAFDESNIANKNPVKARHIIENETKAFCKVFVASRTQFFDKAKEIHEFVDIKRSASVKKENYVVHYICPFSKYELTKYLIKYYKIKINKIIKARKVVAKSPLMTRPFLLSYIDDFIDKKESDNNLSYEFTYLIYEHLIGKWIEREIDFITQVVDKNTPQKSCIKAFNNLLADVVKNMIVNYKNSNEYAISMNDLNSLCNKHGIKWEFNKRSRSLLIRIKDFIFQFAHQSIFEYILADIIYNRKFHIDIDIETLNKLDQFSIFLYEMQSGLRVSSIISSENTENEKILLKRIAITYSTLIIFADVVLVYINSTNRNLNVGFAITVLRSFLPLFPLLMFNPISSIVNKIHRNIWTRKLYIGLDLSGEWYIIQTYPGERDSIEIGVSVIHQNYFNIHMSTEFFNTQYFKDTHELYIIGSSLTTWTQSIGDGTLNTSGELRGTFRVDDTDICGKTYRYGFFDFSIENYDIKKKSDYINGWFVDSCIRSIHTDLVVTDDGQKGIKVRIGNKRKGDFDKKDDSRNGYRMMFRNKYERDQKYNELCIEKYGHSIVLTGSKKY